MPRKKLPNAKYTNMTHMLKLPERYPGYRIQDVMGIDPGYIAQLIDEGIFQATSRAKQELQTQIDYYLKQQSIVDNEQAYIDSQ